MTQSPNPIHQPEASAETTLKLARRLLWIAFCWNDHNFDDAHIEARRTAEECGLKSFEQANEWLATQPPAAPVAAVREAVPLTEAQIEQGRADYGGERFDFTAGVQFAEKFHGILPAASMEADPFLQTR